MSAKFFTIEDVRYRAVGEMPTYQGACQMGEAYTRQTDQETFIVIDDGSFYVVIKE